jgi:hypothetical protein
VASLFTSLSGVFLPRLGQDAARDGGLRAWVTTGTYRPSTSCTPTNIILEDVWLPDILTYVNFDYERFALASWESFSVAKLDWDVKGLAGWPLLKLYYGAFFCAHAVVRAVGEGVVNLDQNQTNFLGEVISIVLGAPVVIRPGVFEFRVYESSPDRLVVELKPASQAGGVHEGFWKFFAAFIDRHAACAAERGAPDARDFIAGAAEVNRILSGNVANSAWYSGTRNEINYQHRYDVWSPIKERRKLKAQMEGLRVVASESVRLDYSGRKDPVATFLATSHYLCMLNFELAEFVAARSAGARSFGGSWRKLKSLF